MPEPLRAILDRALAKDPARRFESAARMAAALRRTIPGGTLEPTTRRLAAAVRRGPTAWIAVAVGLVALAAVVWAARDFMVPDGAPPETTPSTTRLVAPPPPSTSVPSPEPTPLAPRPVARVAATPQPAPSELPSAAPTEELVATPPPAVASAEPAPTPVPTVAPTAEPPPSTVPGPALLTVQVIPWAEVFLDGDSIGVTPINDYEIEPGRHDLLLKSPDYKPFPRRFTVDPGKERVLSIDLTKLGVPLKP